MEIYNKTVIDKKELYDIVNMIQRTGRKKMIITFIFSLLVTAGSVICYIFNILEIWYIFICAGLSVFVLIFIFFVNYMNKKNNSNLAETVIYDYIFYDEYFNLPQNNTNIYYKSLFQVRDMKKYIFLFTNMKSVLIVKKDAFNTKEDLDNFKKILFNNKMLKNTKDEYEFKSK